MSRNKCVLREEQGKVWNGGPVWKERGRLRIPNTLRRGSSLSVYPKTGYTAKDPERIAAHAIGYPQGREAARVMQQKRPPHVGQPLESSVACLQSQTHIVIYP